MNRWAKWGGFGVALLAVAGLASRVVISQQTKGGANIPVCQDRGKSCQLVLPAASTANDLFEPLRPHLEAVLGTRLDAVPKVYRVTTAQVAQLADADLDAHLHWHFPLLRGDTLATTRQVARQIVASTTIAQYVEGTDLILVVPEALPRIARWDQSLAAIDTPQALQLALVHETMRFLLDRRHNLAKLRAACCDGEEFQALMAVIEGRAQSVTRKVAARLGQEAAFPLLARRYLCAPDEAPDPGLRAVSQTALRDRQRACAAGLSFFTTLEEAGTSDVEVRVFARLPRQPRTIARPDLWLAALDKNRPDLAAVCKSLQKALPPDQWQVLEQTWTPAMLAQVAAMLGVPSQRVERLEATWDDGRSLIWSNRQHPGQQIALSMVRHESATAARAYFGFAVDLQRKQDAPQTASCGPAVRVVESQSTAVKLEGFDEAVRNDKVIQYGAGNEPMTVRLLLARAGDLVVECTWYGDNTDEGLAQRLAQAVRAEAR
jgi:hypothetical protein